MSSEARIRLEERKQALVRYGLPILGGALVAVVTSLLFAFIQSYLL